MTSFDFFISLSKVNQAVRCKPHASFWCVCALQRTKLAFFKRKMPLAGVGSGLAASFFVVAKPPIPPLEGLLMHADGPFAVAIPHDGVSAALCTKVSIKLACVWCRKKP
jgi:hypothetical protein